MTLTGIAAAITKADVGILLVKREPDVLDGVYGGDSVPLWDSWVSQVAAQVVPVVGSDPTPGPIRDLAIQCISYGIASTVEYALFPEQQSAGDDGRGWFLDKRFNALLNDLRAMPNGSGEGVVPTGVSRGSFPPPTPYPDPVRPVFRRQERIF